MKKIKVIFAAILLAAFTTAACGNGNSSSSGYNNPMDEEKQKKLLELAEKDAMLTGELENKNIKWLSTWDINADGSGKKTPADLMLFQEIYGGNVEYYRCTDADIYDKLVKSVSSGEGIDFFYGGNMDTFPKCAVNGLFTPYDDYIDLDSPLWADVKDVNDLLEWGGKHYLAVAQVTGDSVAVIYNRKTISQAGLEDPAVLFANDNWTWDTFQELLESYVDVENQQFGIDSWFYEFGLIDTIGVPPVGIQDGKLVNNIGDPSMERVQNRLYELNQKGLIALCVGDYGYTSRPQYIGENKLLFYPAGLYELYMTPDQWKEKFGEDVFFVPMPKDPEADNYYIPTGMESYAFVSGGQNPEGVAKYLDCKRYCAMTEEASAIADSIFIDDYGWTQEMVDMRATMNQMALENPVYDLSKGVSADCGTLLDNSLRLTARGTPWNETYAEISPVVDEYINDINEQAEN